MKKQKKLPPMMTTEDRKCFALLGFCEAVVVELINYAEPKSRRYNKLNVVLEKIQVASDTYPGMLWEHDKEEILAPLVEIEEFVHEYLKGEKERDECGNDEGVPEGSDGILDQ